MRLRVAGLLAGFAFVVLAFAAKPAGARLIYELAPLVGAGATDNVTVASDGQDHFADGFVQVSAIGRARYQARLYELALGYRVMLTRFMKETDLDSVSQSVAATSSINLTGRLTMRLYASGELTHVSSTSPNPDPATVVPQAALATTRPYYSIAGTEEMGYAATPRLNYGQTLSAAHIHFLDAKQGDIPATTIFTLGGYGRRATGRETYSVTAMLSDSIADPPLSTPTMPIPVDPLTTGNVFFGQVLAGWGHELTPTWSTLLQAGPAMIFKLEGPAILSPAGLAMLSYARLPWFMSFTITQTPAPNLLVGQATMTDQAIARVGMPLTRSEMIYVGAFGSYIYARAATAGGSLTRSYDQLQGGASLFVRSPRLPLSGALTYVALTQRGNGSMDHAVQSLAWQSVMLTISGAFSFGPGTPPLFGGVL